MSNQAAELSHTDLTNSGNGIQKNGNSGCTGAARIHRQAKNMDGVESWITSGCRGKTTGEAVQK